MKKLLERTRRRGRASARGDAVGVGTVRVGDAGRRQVFVEVAAVSGETFVGKLTRRDHDPDLSRLRPGSVVLVAFDPAAPQRLSLPTDVQAVSWLASA